MRSRHTSDMASPYKEAGHITHDGETFTTQSVLDKASSIPATEVDVGTVKWVLEHDTPDPARVDAADPSVPVIVAPDKTGRPTVIDGLHRLCKAVRGGHETIPARYLTAADLSDLRNSGEDTPPSDVCI